MKSHHRTSVPVPQRPSVLKKILGGLWRLGFWGTTAFFFCLVNAGCQSTGGNVGRVQSYPFSTLEAAWIRDGEPIEFEDELWYPRDGVEGFQDSEMLKTGDYRGVQVFVDKVDVRPYERVYTKFDRNKFRFFEKRVGE